MNVLLSHIDLNPLFYGLILVLWASVALMHIMQRKFIATVIDLGGFWFVFWLHGGTLTGGMAATVFGLVFSLLAPPIISHYLNREK